mgnify:CR=1 FL=1
MAGTGLDGKRNINAIFMKILPGPFLASARRLMMVAALAAVSLSFGGSGVKAQGSVDLSTDHVTVDLSVIGDSGGSPAALRRPAGGRGAGGGAARGRPAADAAAGRAAAGDRGGGGGLRLRAA